MRRILLTLCLALFLVPTLALAAPVTLLWDPGDPTNPQDHYVMYRKQGQAGVFVRLAEIPKMTTTYTDSTLAPGQVWCYAVTAAKLIEGVTYESVYSNTVCVAGLTAPINLRIQ